MSDLHKTLNRMIKKRKPKEDWVYVIHSYLLDERIRLASDNAKVPDDGMVVYREHELELIDKQNPDRESLKAMHLLKKEFDGEVVEPDI